jgi:hypothetical protein
MLESYVLSVIKAMNSSQRADAEDRKMSNWGTVFLDHYERFLGQPVNREVYRREDWPSIQVLAYDNVFPGCKLLCTLGVTHFEKSLKKACEIYVAVDNDWQEASFLVANILFDIINKETQMGPGLAWNFGSLSTNFLVKYNKSALYFTRPFNTPSEFGTARLLNETAFMYCGFFISEFEYTYFLDHGSQNFEAMLERCKCDPFHLARPTCRV